MDRQRGKRKKSHRQKKRRIESRLNRMRMISWKESTSVVGAVESTLRVG
jgi:hypothetical protein